MPTGIYTASGELQEMVLYVDRYLQDTAIDQFAGNHPLYGALVEGGGVSKWAGGTPWGKDLRVPIMHPAAGGPEAKGVIDPMVEEDPVLMTGMVDTVWQSCYMFMSVAMERRDIARKNSKESRLNYMDTVFKLAQARWAVKQREWLYAAESDPGSVGTRSQLASLRTILNKGGSSATGPFQPWAKTSQYAAASDAYGGANWSDSVHGPACGTSPVTFVGGIERNAANNVYFSCPTINPSSAATFGRDVINQILSEARRGSDHATIMAVSTKHWNQLQAVVQAQQTYAPGRLAKYGFASVLWVDCEIVMDDALDFIPGRSGGTTLQAFAINTKALNFAYPSRFAPVAVPGGHNARRPVDEWSLEAEYALYPTLMGRGLGCRHGNLA